MSSEVRYLRRTLKDYETSQLRLEQRLVEKDTQLTAMVEELKELQTRIAQLISQVEAQRVVGKHLAFVAPLCS